MSRRLLITGGRAPREFVLVDSFVVGRDPNCDLSEHDPLLSRRHAEFVESKNGVEVRDLASRNGILVNGVKIPHAVLRDGDVVQVGSLQVKYLESAGPFIEPIVVAPPPAAEVAPPTVILGTVASGFSRKIDDVDATNLPAKAGSHVEAGSHIDDDSTMVMDPFANTPRPAGNTDADSATIRLDQRRFVAPGGRFRFEMPAVGWRLVSGGSVSLLTLAYEGGGAAMVVERVPRDSKMSTIISSETFVASERDIVSNLQPEAEVIDAGVGTLGARRLVIVNYSRPGVRGPERARQYSYAEGSGVYRLTCSAVASRFAQFESVFAQVAATFEIESSS